MHRECWNKFLFFLSLFLFFFSPEQCTGIWLLLLAIFIYTLSYYIILYGSWLHLTSLHLAEILGGNFR